MRDEGGPNSTVSAAKSVYYVPLSVQELLAGDADRRLKVVTIGVKVFERKDGRNGQHEYRLQQDGVHSLLPFISKRIISVTAQDFCNILGGGLVSFATLSFPTVTALSTMASGVFICSYAYNVEDVIGELKSDRQEHFELHATCWRGGSRSINVMCGKVEVERMKHQLEALHVIRYHALLRVLSLCLLHS